MKIVFMGTPEFALPSLLALIASEHQILFVVTQPDRPQGRGYKLLPPPVKVAARAAGLSVLQPGKLGEIKDQFLAAEPDAVVVIAFGQKIPAWLLGLPKFGCINLHPSLLPKYRGAAPMQAAILNNDLLTGITSMRLDEGWDTGDILLQEQVQIRPGETGGELHDRLKELGAPLILQTLAGLQNGKIVPVKQNDSVATFAPKLTKEAAKIDWASSAAQITAQIRAYNPWPVAWTTIGGETLKVWRSEAVEDNKPSESAGMVLSAGPAGILVATGQGLVNIQEIQKPGGKPMDSGSFVRGFPLLPGTKLGI